MAACGPDRDSKMTEEEEFGYENILVEMQAGVMQVTLNRPEKFNALSVDALGERHEAMMSADEDPDVGAVVITGSPETKRPAFAAGADISEMAGLDVMTLRSFALFGQEVLLTIENLDKPVIAAVNGLALGGGCELAMASHVRLASEDAAFGQPEINLGLIPGFGGSQRLPRLIGRGPAFEMLLTGDAIDAATALRLGLVNKVVPGDQLLAEAGSLAEKMASKAPLARELILDVVNRGAALGIEQALRIEADLFGSMASTEDTRNGLTAFLEKRKPEWKGC